MLEPEKKGGKRKAALLLPEDGMDEEIDNEEDGMDDEGLDAAMSEFLDAVDMKDTKAMGAALKTALDIIR